MQAQRGPCHSSGAANSGFTVRHVDISESEATRFVGHVDRRRNGSIDSRFGSGSIGCAQCFIRDREP